jgi:predicted enzyme related to lactoylglutathione lyase
MKDPKTKVINWFQIPVLDIKRATTFYKTVLGASFHEAEHMGEKHAFFAMDTLESLRTGGELVETPHNKPSAQGAVIYLNAPQGVDIALAAVEKAGGKIIMPLTPIGENGVISLISDTEGNTIGLHSVPGR